MIRQTKSALAAFLPRKNTCAFHVLQGCNKPARRMPLRNVQQRLLRAALTKMLLTSITDFLHRIVATGWLIAAPVPFLGKQKRGSLYFNQNHKSLVPLLILRPSSKQTVTFQN